MKQLKNCLILNTADNSVNICVASNFMTDHIDIPYSKTFAYFALVIMAGLISLLTITVLNDDPIKWKGNGLLYLGIMDILCFILTLYLIIKYLIPATKKQIAVTINNDYIIDNIRNNKIKWENVKAIRSVSSRSSSFIAIDLDNSQEITGETNNVIKKILFASNKFFYGTPILISTQFLEGSTKDLLKLFLSFFERQKLLATKGFASVGLDE